MNEGEDLSLLDIYRRFPTTEGGRCTVDSLTEEDYLLSVSLEGSFPADSGAVDLKIPADAGKEFEFRMRRGGGIDGRITNLAGTDLAESLCQLLFEEVHDPPPTWEHWIEVDSTQGTFRSKRLFRPGLYRAALSREVPHSPEGMRRKDSDREAKDQPVSLGTFEIKPGETTPLSLRLP